MKYCFLFDASAVVHYYLPKKEYEETLAYLMSLKKRKEACFFIPSFCIAEVKNTFAKLRYRIGTLPVDIYNKIRSDFLEQVSGRNTFYSYDLNRYHNINTDLIFEAEHTNNTEFDIVGRRPKGNNLEELENDANRILKEAIDQGYSVSKIYLSSYDILIIAMALELQRFFGESKVFIVTKDKRLNIICGKGKLAKVIYLPDTKIAILIERLKNN